jgi:hypothetical protein
MRGAKRKPARKHVDENSRDRANERERRQRQYIKQLMHNLWDALPAAAQAGRATEGDILNTAASYATSLTRQDEQLRREWETEKNTAARLKQRLQELKPESESESE